jgi:hypothetical protein
MTNMFYLCNFYYNISFFSSFFHGHFENKE